MRGGPRTLQNSRLRPPAKYGQTWVFGRASRSAVLALATQHFDGSERFGLRTHRHAKILSKFEVLGPRNGRGATWQNASQVNIFTICTPKLKTC